ncbi:MAG: hypothetical protein IJJ69_07440, partial [Oscillospiraceae bacterium]|nr:hypothetical protein [Oscillospiraceae bacterium]
CALFSQENRITTRLNKYRYLKIKASLSENPNSEYKVFKSYELFNSEEQIYIYDYDEYEYLIMDLNISQEDNNRLQQEFKTLKKITQKPNKLQKLISKLKKEKS